MAFMERDKVREASIRHRSEPAQQLDGEIELDR